MATKNFTTTLNEETIKHLTELSEKFSTTKNKVIENLVTRAYKNARQAELAKQYEAIKDDSEMLYLAEAGIEDWAANLEKYDES